MNLKSSRQKPNSSRTANSVFKSDRQINVGDTLSRGSLELSRPRLFSFMLYESFVGVGAVEAGAAPEQDEQEWRRQLAWDSFHQQWTV